MTRRSSDLTSQLVGTVLIETRVHNQRREMALSFRRRFLAPRKG